MGSAVFMVDWCVAVLIDDWLMYVRGVFVEKDSMRSLCSSIHSPAVDSIYFSQYYFLHTTVHTKDVQNAGVQERCEPDDRSPQAEGGVEDGGIWNHDCERCPKC